jgi:proline iminopeptidase
MRTALAIGVLLSTWSDGAGQAPVPLEVRVPAANATLYAREVGHGQAIVVLHGGPDFDSSYLLPDMDRLSDAYRLVYYDQRGRGRSADGVQPEDVTIASEMDDLDKVRQHFQLGSTTLLGHSWGAILAAEYAIRHPDRVSHLVFMNPAPLSRDDFRKFRAAYVQLQGANIDRLNAAAATDGYKAGDPDAVDAYYRIHFKPAFARQEDYERFMPRLKASFTREGVLKARAVERRLDDETWLSNGYDLLPKLRRLRIPTLVIVGDHDFIPAATAAAPIAAAIPNARLAELKDCGHFSYMECPGAVRKELSDFFQGRR